MKKITRRDFLSKSVKAGAGISLWPLISSCTGQRAFPPSGKRMVILGIDGMDPFLLKQFVSQGAMPNFMRLIQEGGFRKMRSSIPPQSPVAWSDFAVGASASVHGIFDFIHRDPKTMIPYLSTAAVSEPSHTLSLGDWEIPLSSGTVKQLREGKTFWEYLEEAEIPATIFKLPSNFPVRTETIRCVSGMGTPDLLGTYGTFSFFTSNHDRTKKAVTGGKLFPVKIVDNKVVTELAGPVNSLKKGRPNTSIPFTIWRDPQNDVVKIKLQDHELILAKGEWTDWLQLTFDSVPYLSSVKGLCKLYLKNVHPDFEMYISPINIDPADTKALSYGILSEDEYLELSRQILEESKKAFQFELKNLRDHSKGLLFFYFSNLDQDSHMYWRAIDAAHPLYKEDLGNKYDDVIKNLYIQMDAVLGEVYKKFNVGDDNFRLVVMSDHGFAPFYRSVNLNTWLLENGYVTLFDPSSQEDHTFFENVNWQRTKAYGLGINALYLNLEGRERYGIVSKAQTEKTIKELKSQLLALKDPINGSKAVTNVWTGKEIYGREDDKTPDLIIGWNRGYRASWKTVLGGFPREVFVNNDDKWSGDHCIDPFWVPAVLLCNKRITKQRLRLPDVTATILSEFNIPIPPQMTGKPIYEI
jgi:predicted AlkP superfamily phosphohydrolase/phosphomutase